jgi:signal transduction histidine kinase
VVRHADAHAVAVAIERTDDVVRLTVTDDGKGFDPAHRAISARTLGLVSMRERAADHGGFVTIESTPGAGTTVRAEVPAR